MNRLTDRPELARASALFALSCAASREHDRQARRALAIYGNHGAQISGCVRDHFPAPVKDALRELARTVRTMSEDARAARPRGVHAATLNKLAREVATRDGSGFYGSQGIRT